MSRRDQIADDLDVSVGNADQIRSLLNKYDVADITAVLAANLEGVPPTALDDLTDVVATGGSEGDVLTQQNDGSFALEAPSGGSQPSTFSLGPYTFTFESDLDALAAAEGVELFTPNVGDVVMVFHENVAPWDSAPDDQKLSAFVRVGTFQGAGTMLAPADQTGPMWSPDGDIPPFDESGDIAVQPTKTTTVPWGVDNSSEAFSYMGRMLVSTPICARITDPDGNAVGTYEGQFEDPPVPQLLPGVGESRLYFLVMRPTLTLPS